MPRSEDRTLRRGIVFDDSLDRPDGVQQYIFTLTSWLRARGHEIYFLVGETKRSDIPHVYSLAKNIKVKFNGNVLSIPMAASKKQIKTLLDELNLDILHVQTPYSPLMGGKIIKLAGNTPVIGTFHTLPFSKLVVVGNRLLSLITHSTDKKIARMITATPPAQKFAASIYHYKTVLVPDPVALADFVVPKGDKANCPHIVFLGRLVERKGAQHVLKALVHMYDHELYREPVVVTIAGRGEMLEELQNIATYLPDFVTVRFPGFIAEEEKAALLESGDIVALPSTSGECFGISVVEALQASRGVVLAGDNAGYASVLHGMPELIIKPSETAQFAQTLADWLSSPAERAAVAKKQKAYVRQFDIELIGPKVESVYRETLQNYSKP